MDLSISTSQNIHIAVVEDDPLRLVGLRAILESEPDFDLITAVPPKVLMQPVLNLVLVGDRRGANVISRVSTFRAMRPDLPIIVVGPGNDDEAIISVIASGAKGYVFDGAHPSEFAQAIRTVSQGSIWAPRRVLSTIIERAGALWKGIMPGGYGPITRREKDVLKLLVTGLSNREIGAPLGIEERTVKAHIAKMMRKVGVQNRVELSVYAIRNSLVAHQSPRLGTAVEGSQ
jgi:DNA-binding NarL/FixJ family response regulator